MGALFPQELDSRRDQILQGLGSARRGRLNYQDNHYLGSFLRLSLRTHTRSAMQRYNTKVETMVEIG